MASYSLINDIIFKIVFGTETNRPLLRALLNALLGLAGEDRITELTILNPLIDKEYMLAKDAVLDVKARDGRGHQYNIEVQLTCERSYVARAIYYLSRLYTSQLDKGEPYSKLSRTIGISLVDFELIPGLEDLHSRYRFYDEVHGRELTDILELHFIELAKFRGDKPRGLRSPFEKWLHVLKFGDVLYGDRESAIPEELREEEGIEMALEAMRNASASEQVREMIEFRRKAEHDEATRLESARLKGLEEGQELGRKAGQEEGREEGREEGQELGRKAGQERLKAVARNLRESGMDIETVRRMTGLDAGDID
ncbi:MAG: Rpn family recombination-promoting nuclease/putative transposase [Dehalococcoidia bacterium]|nr:Rpn family recombination-promoting nuclease/putative transposase [Dehalococcoidia bacterium]